MSNSRWVLAISLVFWLYTGTSRAQEPIPDPPMIEIPDSLAQWPTLEESDGKVSAQVTEIKRRKLTLQEIIERSIVGEQGKLAGHQDVRYLMSLRVGMWWKKKKEIEEYVLRGFSDADGASRSVQLSHQKNFYKKDGEEWILNPDQDEDLFNVQAGDDGFADFQDLPFFLEMAHEFWFELEERFFRGDHVIFKIGFKPRSSFKPLPSGTVYVDTSAYRIIHEEYVFDQSPYPLFIGSIDHVSRHWEELPTGEWVWSKMNLEVNLRNFSFGYAPQRIAMVFNRDRFEFDQGYDEHLFGKQP